MIHKLLHRFATTSKRKRALIIRIGAIGDVAMALPMGKLLEEEYEITWVVGKEAAPLIAWADIADETIVIDHKKLLESSFFIKLKELIAVWGRLFGRRFDLVLTAHPDPRYRLLSLFCRKTTHRFFARYPRREFPVRGRFHGAEYSRLAGHSHQPLLHISEKPRWRIILAPGGTCLDRRVLRRWPIESYEELSRLLQQEGLALTVIGGKEDLWMRSYFSGCDDYIGKTNLGELISLFQETRLTIGHDSGPLHCARLGGSPILGLFGPTNPHEFLHLASGQEHALWGGEKLACRPCYDGKTFANCANPLCMKSITPEMVLKQVKGILYAHSSHS